MGTFTIATPVLPTETCTIKMMVDTGSGVSILSQHIFKEHFRSCAMSPPKVQLLTYSKEKIPMCGYLTLNVTYCGKTAAVRAAVSTKLKMLEEIGIIEKIDSSEWVSPIVVTKRKNNTIRLCIDLREPN
ncbi:uncharacterized protein K02A2.6-like [Tachysurus ichikawai]